MDENHSDKSQDFKLILRPLSEREQSLLLSNMKEIPSIQLGEHSLHLELDELSPEIKEIAKNELRETPEVVRDAIDELKELLKGEKNLRAPLHNENWLIRFLRPCKFYPQSAFELIKSYYKFKITHEDIYRGLKPSNEKNVFEQNILLFQQERDQYGRRLLTIELGKKWKPSKVTLDEFFKGEVLLLELGILEPQTQVCGVVIILDLDGLSLAQAMKFTPTAIKRLLDWLQDCVPMRIKNIHVVNQPSVFKIVYNLFKPFLREKLKKRLVFHGENRESLHQYIVPRSLMPAYGGTLQLPSAINGRQWLEILVQCDPEYEAINSYGYETNKC